MIVLSVNGYVSGFLAFEMYEIRMHFVPNCSYLATDNNL